MRFLRSLRQWAPTSAATARLRRLCGLAVVAALLAVPALRSQPAQPVPPAKFNAQLRYQLSTQREQRVLQFRAMVRQLEKVGFTFVPALEDLPPTLPENTNVNTLTGTIAGKDAPKLLSVPAVESVLLVPQGFKLPDKAEEPVPVQLELTSGLPTDRQQELAEQVRALLQYFGFQEDIAYDHRGLTGQPNTRLRGTLPVGNLGVMLKDLRGQPAGWFGPKIPRDELPAPFSRVNPVRLTQVLIDPSPPKAPAPPPDRGDPRWDIISPALWALAQAKVPAAKPVRIEMLLVFSPDEANEEWRRVVQKTAPDLVIEGILGNVVTGVFGSPRVNERGELEVDPVNIGPQVRELAKVPFVSALRLPRTASAGADPTIVLPADNSLALEKSGLAALHQKGHRGKGVRIAVVDSDFRGYRAAVAKGLLPKDTRLVDLTLERNVGLRPDPMDSDAALLGRGTQCAAAAALAAPQAQLTLVRIDAAAPYMLGNLLMHVRGELLFSRNLLQRHDALKAAAAEVEAFKREVYRERELLADNFEDEREEMLKYDFLGAVRPWLFTLREWHELRMAELAERVRAHRADEKRLLDHLESIRSLRDIDIVSCSLYWDDGYPVGGRSILTRTIDDKIRPEPDSVAAGGARGTHSGRPARATGPQPPLWIQAAGDLRGQTWNDAFRDDDGNGVMEFVGPQAKLPEGRWTGELNTFGWVPLEKEQMADLPAKHTFRVSLQWTEPHDPDYAYTPGDRDWYRKPLAELRLLVLRQRDPQAKTLPADAFEVVAVSHGLPQRLHATPREATYEIAVEFTTDRPGPYALRVERERPARWLVVEELKGEGLRFVRLSRPVATGLTPAEVPALPEVERKWQLRPRLFVEAVAGPDAAKGRPVFRDFYTDRGSVAIPADGREVIAVGAARFDGRAEIYTSVGPPADLDLFVSPRVYAYDRLGGAGKARGPAFGSMLSAPFAAGMTATFQSSGKSREQISEFLRPASKKVLKIPSAN